MTQDVTVRFVKGGHLGMLMGSRAERTWRLTAEWLDTRSRYRSRYRATPAPKARPATVVPLPATSLPLPVALRKVS